MTGFTESDVRYELGASFILPLTPRFQDRIEPLCATGLSAEEAAIIVHDCQEEISRQEDVEVQAPGGGGGGGGGWSGTVMANHSEGLARILARPTLSLHAAACQSLTEGGCVRRRRE